MTELFLFIALVAVLALSHLEHRQWAEERRRLTAAALSVTPQQAAAFVQAAAPAAEARPRRPIPEGL